MNKVLVFALVLGLGAPAALAQDTPAPATAATGGMLLLLEEAEQRALDRNPAIAAARLSRQAAGFSLAESRAAYDPLFNASLTQRSQTTPASTQLSGGQEQVNTDASTYSTGISQALPWGGGSLSLDFGGSRTASSNVFATYNPSFSSSLTASITQPLLRGLRFDGTRAQIAQAEISSDIADLELQERIATTLAGVRRAYWELVYASDALETARQSRALAERQLQDNRLRVELGTVAPIDIVESEAEVAARHQAVVQAEGAFRTAQVALKQLMVADAGDAIWQSTIVPTDRPTQGSAAIDVAAAIASAVANRSDIAIARKERESSGAHLKLLDDRRKPAVDLVAEYSVSGIGGTRILRQSGGLGSDVIGSVQGGYLDVLQSIGALDYPTWIVGVNVTVPFGNKASQAAYAQAQVQQRQREVQVQALEVEVTAQVTRIAEQVRSAGEQVRAAGAARDLARKRLDAEEARRAAGLSTTFLVLQAQRDLAAAQTAELRALLDFRTALVDFELVQQVPV
ncbi:MAG TPA: TolC family protein [Vicinamibacterales bacterium]